MTAPVSLPGPARAGAVLAVLLAILVSVQGLAPRAAAQEPPEVEIEVSLEPATATLGERIELTITAEHARDLLVTADDPPRTITELERVSRDPDTTTVDPATGRATTTFRWVYAAFTLGEIAMPPITVSWLRTDGGGGESQVQPPALTIERVRPAGDDALRPLKPQLMLAEGAPPIWLRPALIAGSVVASFALAAALWAWAVRRRRQVPEPLPSTVPLSAEDRARGALGELRVPDEDDAVAQYQSFYGELSLIVRRYLEERFDFTATARTTSELARLMTRFGVGRWQARLVAGLLERCDAAIYAHVHPDPASVDHDLTVAYEIVELSRPPLSQDAVEVPA